MDPLDSSIRLQCHPRDDRASKEAPQVGASTSTSVHSPFDSASMPTHWSCQTPGPSVSCSLPTQRDHTFASPSASAGLRTTEASPDASSRPDYLTALQARVANLRNSACSSDQLRAAEEELERASKQGPEQDNGRSSLWKVSGDFDSGPCGSAY